MHLPDYGRNIINLGARIDRTATEGPGIRQALWVQGCPIRCPGCCNPHLLDFKPADLMTVDDLFQDIIETNGIEGVTFVGGEPFTQAAALDNLANRVQTAGLSVVVFTGFELKYLQNSGNKDWLDFLNHIDMLIDGPYIKFLHTDKRRWIGSANQKVHFLTNRYAHMTENKNGWDKTGNTIEIRMKGNTLHINGFPHKLLTRELNNLPNS